MPSINEVIERNDKIKPNSFDETTKADWLYRLDGRISKEIMHTEPPVQYTYPEDGDKELLVPFPFDAVYDFYLHAKRILFCQSLNQCFCFWSRRFAFF